MTLADMSARPIQACARGVNAFGRFAAVTAIGAIFAASAHASYTLQWLNGDDPSNETGFVIQRSDNGGAFAQIASVGPTATAYQDTTANGTDTYAYQVYAYNSYGVSPYSNVATNAPTFTTEPIATQNGPYFGTATFSVVAIGIPAPNYRWQVSTDGGVTWSNLSDGPNVGGSGTATLTLSDLSSANAAMYQVIASNGFLPNAVSSSSTLTVIQASQTITFGALSPATYGQAPFALGATASSGLTVSYASSNLAVATVSGDVVTIVGGGTTTITASQPGDSAYTPAASVQETLTVNPAPQTVTFPTSLSVGFGTGPYTLSATASSGLPVTFNVANGTGVAQVTGDMLSIVGIGDAVIGAFQAGNADYLPETAYEDVTVGRGPQTITFGTLPVLLAGGAPYALVATTSSGLPVSFSSSNPALASISGSTLTVGTSGGQVTITASQPGNGFFVPATNVQQTLEIGSAPAISTQPVAQTANVGASATFTVSATGNPPPTYVWKVSTNGGSSYTMLSDGAGISGSATASLTLSNLTAGMNNNLYEVVATYSLGAVTSSAAALTVDFAPSFTGQPSAQTANAGASSTFTVSTTGNPAPTYQWMVSTNGGSTYTALTDGAGISGSATANLTLSSLTAAMNGNKYEVVATNSVSAVTSNPTTLTVDFAPGISTQPLSQTTNAGTSATFTVSTTGNPPPTYQWMVSTNGGASWSNLTNGGVYSNVTTASFTITGATAAMNGYEYEALAINASAPSGIASSAATLTVNGVAFASSPFSQSVLVGGSTAFSVAAVGNPVATYQWQVSTDGGGTWTNLANGGVYSNVTTSTLAITGATLAMNGYQYRAAAAKKAVARIQNAAAVAPRSSAQISE